MDYRDHNCFSIPKTDDNLPEIFKFSMFHYYRNQIKILPASFNLNGFCKEKIIFRNVHFGKKKVVEDNIKKRILISEVEIHFKLSRDKKTKN